jgi:hypothetical protein
MFVRRLFKLGFLSIVLLLAGIVTLISASVYTFTSLSDESLIAELRFDALGPQHYLATLATGDGCEAEQFELYGDQWRVDAEFVKWKYWALLLGLDSQYRLERLEGRYRTAAEQNTSLTLAHDLGDRNAIDVVGVAAALGPLNFLLDATYGTSTYEDIDTERTYRVYRSQTGLLTRSEPLVGRAPNSGSLSVEVTRACGGQPSRWERFTRWANRTLTTL